MANTDNPTGLTPVRYLNGAPWNGQANLYWASAATDTTALFIGDPVTLSALGSNSAQISGSQGAYPPATLASVKAAAAGAGTVPILGVVVAVEPVLGAGADQQNSTVHRVASTERLIWVADDPMLIFEIQEDNDSGDLAATNVNSNADLIATAAGSAVTGLSGFELDSSSAAATATLDLQILRLVNRADNELGDFAKWEVRINLHQYNMTDATTGSVGIA